MERQEGGVLRTSGNLGMVVRHRMADFGSRLPRKRAGLAIPLCRDSAALEMAGSRTVVQIELVALSEAVGHKIARPEMVGPVSRKAATKKKSARLQAVFFFWLTLLQKTPTVVGHSH